MNLVNKLF